MVLRIHEYVLTLEQLERGGDALVRVYEQLPGFIDFDARDSVPYWFGKDENAHFLFASVEPAGVLIEGVLDEKDWLEWLHAFCESASTAIGERIRPDPELSETEPLSNRES
jgi:hypothetical protein